jgi:hypothetical protein
MSPTAVYRLAIPAAYRLLVVATMVVFSLVGLGLIVAIVWSGARALPFPFVVLWCGALIWNWYILLGIPYEIRIDETERISFVALRGTKTLSPASLHSIKPYRAGGGFYVIRHETGTIRLLAQMTGFHEVISRLKAANPNFEVVGI